MLYEAMLLFGVLAVAGALFAILLEQRHALYLRQELQYLLFLVLGLYFVWFWVHGGQTLAMKTWRVKVVSASGAPVGYARATLRYLLAWCWFLPGMAVASASGAQGGALLLLPAANIALWALLSFLDPQRQFLHDRIAGTRLVEGPAPQPRKKR